MKKSSCLFSFVFLISSYLICQPTIQWQKSYGGGFIDAATSIIQTLDGGYMTVGMGSNFAQSDFLVIKLDANGNIQWQNSYGGLNDELAMAVVQMPDSGYIIGGQSGSNDGQITNHHGPVGIEDYWVIRIDKNGVLLWQNSLGGSSTDILTAIDINSAGRVVLGGWTRSTDGDITFIHTPSPFSDYWIVEIDPLNGGIIWQKCYGGSSSEACHSVAFTSDGGFIVSGESQSTDGDVTFSYGNGDYWVVKLNSTGLIQWQSSLGGSSGDVSSGIIQDSNGEYTAVGYSFSNNGNVSGNNGFIDYWAAKLNTLGTFQWGGSYGGSLGEANPFTNPLNNMPIAGKIRQTSDGGYVIGGYSHSNDFQVTGHHGSTNHADYWLLKIDAGGNLVWQKSLGGGYKDCGYDVRQTTDGGFIMTGFSGSTDGDVTNNNGSWDFWVVKLACSAPIAGFNSATTVCVSDTVFFTNTTNYFDSVRWLVNGIPFSTNPNPYLIFNLSGTYTITLIALSGNCSGSQPMSDTISQIITVNPLPIVTFSGLAIGYCINASSVTLTGSPSGGTFTGNGISGNVFTPSSAGVGTHNIIYTYTDVNGCTNKDTQTVVVNNPPILSIGNLNASYCINSPTSVLVGNPVGGTFSGNGISGNTFDPFLAGVGTFLITYTYTDSIGCSDSISQSVTVNPIPIVTFSGLAPSYCINSSIANLNGSPLGGTFSGNGILGNTFSPLLAGSGTHSIIYSYTDLNGCTNADTQLVTVNPLPIVGFTGLAATYCINDPAVVLVGTPSGGTFSGTGMSANTFIPANAGAGVFTITYSYTDLNGCSDSASQLVTVQPLPIALASGDTTICLGEFTTLLASGGSSYLWSNGSTLSSISANPTITSTYSVTVTNNCGSSSTVITVSVNIPPTILVSPDTTISVGGSVQLSASGGSNYMWSPTGGLSCTNCPAPNASPTVTTTYTVIVTNSSGCSSTGTVTVYVEDVEVFVPSAFSPNNDGANDILFVRGKGIKSIQFSIYDRVGEKIFETTELTIGWDGTFKGNSMNSGVFTYIVEAVMVGDVLINQKGEVTLVR